MRRCSHFRSVSWSSRPTGCAHAGKRSSHCLPRNTKTRRLFGCRQNKAGNTHARTGDKERDLRAGRVFVEAAAAAAAFFNVCCRKFAYFRNFLSSLRDADTVPEPCTQNKKIRLLFIACKNDEHWQRSRAPFPPGNMEDVPLPIF